MSEILTCDICGYHGCETCEPWYNIWVDDHYVVCRGCYEKAVEPFRGRITNALDAQVEESRKEKP